MRTLLLIAAISAAGQLPSRDAPAQQRSLEAVADGSACAERVEQVPASVLLGPTVFAPAGHIA